MRQLFWILLLGLVFGELSSAQAQSRWTTVNYTSGNTVYVAAGREDGIQKGDTLLVFRGRKRIARLKVVYVAAHSASCKILEARTAIVPGLKVKFQPHRKSTTEPRRNTPPPAARVKSPPPSAKKRHRTPHSSKRGSVRIRGGLDLSFFRSAATVGSGFTYQRPAARFKFNIDRFWGGHRLVVYFRYYQIQRQNVRTGSIPAVDTRYRLYTAALERTQPEHRLQYLVGRITAYPVSGLGYLDGALVSVAVGAGLRLGAFGGTEPDWETFAFRATSPKFGAFISHEINRTAYRGTSALAYITSRTDGVENRTYLYARSNWSIARSWYVASSFEIDINRDWRREKSGQTFSFSNLFLMLQYRLIGGHSISLSYDTRRNYWTYFYRTLSDSLFDTRLRQGLRLSLSARLPGHIFALAYANGNLRQGEQRLALAGGFSLMKRQLVWQQLSAGIQGNLFRDVFSTGGFGQLWAQVHAFSRMWSKLAIGYRGYTFGEVQRTNQWLRLEVNGQILAHIYASLVLEQYRGDDFTGFQQFLELHYGF